MPSIAVTGLGNRPDIVFVSRADCVYHPAGRRLFSLYLLNYHTPHFQRRLPIGRSNAAESERCPTYRGERATWPPQSNRYKHDDEARYGALLSA